MVEFSRFNLVLDVEIGEERVLCHWFRVELGVDQATLLPIAHIFATIAATTLMTKKRARGHARCRPRWRSSRGQATVISLVTEMKIPSTLGNEKVAA